jgi:putative transcriptional regulator
MGESESLRELVARRIAGEIVLSPNPGLAMRKWRALFRISQVQTASEMECSPSVISDYETGRRRAPGSTFVKRFVEALIDIDERSGGQYIQNLARMTMGPSEAIIDIKEFPVPVKMHAICDAVEGEVLIGESALNLDVFGYTIIDSIKAIENLSGLDFYRIFGSTSERALVFTGVTTGRSPMIAVKISPFKPRVVILHGKIKKVDELAVRLAQHENVPLILSRRPSVEELVDDLSELYRKTVAPTPNH